MEENGRSSHRVRTRRRKEIVVFVKACVNIRISQFYEFYGLLCDVTFAQVVLMFKVAKFKHNEAVHFCDVRAIKRRIFHSHFTRATVAINVN